MAASNLCILLQIRHFSVLSRTPTLYAKKNVSIDTKFFQLVASKPKKPASSFLRFLRKHYDEIIRTNPRASRTEISRIAADKWKNAEDDEKSKIKLEYSKDYLNYKASLEEYNGKLREFEKIGLTEADGKNRKYIKAEKVRMGKPSGPLNAYMAFILDLKKSYKGELGKKFFQEASQIWNKLASDQKEMYFSKAKKDLEKYEQEMQKWESKMLELGYDHLVRTKSRSEASNKV